MGRRGIFVFSALCAVVTALAPLGRAVAVAATVPKPVVSKVSPASPASGPAASLKWSPWKRVDGNGAGSLWFAGCLSSTDCFAIDTGGNVVSWNGSAWSRPEPTPLKADTIRLDGDGATSCPSSSFCMAVGDGIAATYSRGAWTETTGVPAGGPYFQSVSCTSATFCMATDQADVTEYNGKTWTDSVAVDGNADHSDDRVSCASASFCVLTTMSGGVFSWNGSAWKQTVTALPGVSANWPIPVSCVSGTWCMAVDHSGDVYTFDGTRWSKAGAAGSSNSPLKLVCTSAKFCVAADTNGDFARYNGSAWTVSSSVFTGADALSSGTDLACAGQTCVAVTGGDVSMASTFAGGRWSRQVTVDRSGQLNAISCPATGFCAATGYSADAVTRHDGTWAPPVRLPDGAAPLYLSWTSATFCLAGDDVSGRIWRYNGISWTTAPSVPGAVTFLTALSCVNRSFCVAAFLPSAEKSSGLATYNGTRWTAVKPFDANNLWSVNCPSAKFCAAVGSGSLDGGTPFATFNGKTWSARASVRYAHGKGAGDGIVPALSCTSASFCAMSTLNLANDVGVTTFNGKTWTLKTLFRGDNTTTVVVSGLSCAPGGKACVAALTNGRIFTFDGTDWSGPGNSGRVNLEYGGVDVAVSCASPKFCAAAQGNGYVSIGT